METTLDVNMDQKVLEFLREQTDPVSPQCIAEEVLKNEATVSDANKILYRLKSQKLVEKTADEKTNRHPHWRALPLSEEMKKKELWQTKIYFSLLEKKEEWVSTRHLVAHFSEENLTRSEINSILYSLLRQKKVEKRMDANGRNPEWKIISN